MCKKKNKPTTNTFVLEESFREDIDDLEVQLYGLNSDDWESIKPILIKMEEIKLKYIGEYDYGESF